MKREKMNHNSNLITNNTFSKTLINLKDKPKSTIKTQEIK